MSDTKEYGVYMKAKDATTWQHDAAKAAHLYLSIVSLSTDTDFPIFSIEVQELKRFAQERLTVLFGEDKEAK